MITYVVYEVSAGKNEPVWAFARANDDGAPGFVDVTYFEPGGIAPASGAEPDWAHVRFLFTYNVDLYDLNLVDDGGTVELRRR